MVLVKSWEKISLIGWVTIALCKTCKIICEAITSAFVYYPVAAHVYGENSIGLQQQMNLSAFDLNAFSGYAITIAY